MVGEREGLDDERESVASQPNDGMPLIGLIGRSLWLRVCFPISQATKEASPGSNPHTSHLGAMPFKV